jgi:3-dehydroquinate dehydratase/shikimate dehydrogenase
MEMVKAGTSAALSQGADLVEIRLDYLQNPLDIAQTPLKVGIPTIATMRRETDGGRFHGSEETKWEILRGIAGNSDYIDLEFDTAKIDRVEELHGGGSKVIISHHDFQKTPSRKELISLLFRAKNTDGDLVKIATMVHNRRDLMNLLTLPLIFPSIIVVPMGREGKIGRIMAPLFGSSFAYATLDGLPPVAPGMLSVRQMRQIFDSIENATR